jgi:hypothetical protein
MSTGSVSGPRPQRTQQVTTASGPAAPAAPAGASPAAPAHAPGAPAPADSYGSAARADSPASSAVSGGAARPTADRASLRARTAGVAADTRPNPRDNPQVFDRQGRMSPDGLRGLDQYASDPTGTSAQSRCSANSSVAGLAMRGNQAMMQGFLNAATDIARQMGQTTDPARIGELALAQGTLLGLAAKAASNNIQRSDLNSAADALWHAYDSDKTDPSHIMTYPDIARMNQGLGLMPASQTGEQGVEGRTVGHATFQPPNPPTSDFDVNTPQFRDAQRRVANDVVGRLQPGDTALVGIFNPAPGGGGTDQPNHIITVGKNAQGQMYLYDPANSPNYMTGRDAENHLRSHIGIGMRNPQDTHGPGGRVTSRTWDVYAAATFMPQNRQVTAPPAQTH